MSRYVICSFVHAAPQAFVGIQRRRWHEHLNVWMKLQLPRMGMQYGHGLGRALQLFVVGTLRYLHQSGT